MKTRTLLAGIVFILVLSSCGLEPPSLPSSNPLASQNYCAPSAPAKIIGSSCVCADDPLRQTPAHFDGEICTVPEDGFNAYCVPKGRCSTNTPAKNVDCGPLSICCRPTDYSVPDGYTCIGDYQDKGPNAKRKICLPKGSADCQQVDTTMDNKKCNQNSDCCIVDMQYQYGNTGSEGGDCSGVPVDERYNAICEPVGSICGGNGDCKDANDHHIWRLTSEGSQSGGCTQGYECWAIHK